MIMWPTKRFQSKWLLSPVTSFCSLQRFPRRLTGFSGFDRQWRRFSVFTAGWFLPPSKCYLSKYSLAQTLIPRWYSTCSQSGVVNLNHDEQDGPEAQKWSLDPSDDDGASVTEKAARVRRRRPLRKLVVSNIGEQRLHNPRALEYEQKWNAHVKKLEAFVTKRRQRQKGQSFLMIKTTDYPKDPTLRNWLRRIRGEYQKKLRGRPNRLTDQRMEQLRNLGFQFMENLSRNSWDLRFNQLCTYLKDHNGHYPHESLISTLDAEEKKLYLWCNRQRVLYKLYMSKNFDRTYINEERIQKLNDINFVWSVQSSQWDEKYEELKKYYESHGNSMVPSRYVGNYSLSRWVETQRRQFNLRNKNQPSSLTNDRIQLLNKLEFVWDPFEVRWMERYQELVEFQRLNGEGVMPSHVSNPSLHRWLKLQQKNYRQWIAGETSQMNEQRKERLENLGMDWTPSRARKPFYAKNKRS